MTLIGILASAGLVLLLGAAMFLGVSDQDRRSRDAERVSQVRQAQAALGAFRARAGSYPGAAADLSETDAALADGFGYQAQPAGCGADLPQPCTGYQLTFSLEGPVGLLDGKACRAGPQGLSCSR